MKKARAGRSTKSIAPWETYISVTERTFCQRKVIGNSNNKRKRYMLEAIKIYENTLKNIAINRTEKTETVPKYWKQYFKWKHKSYAEVDRNNMKQHIEKPRIIAVKWQQKAKR